MKKRLFKNFMLVVVMAVLCLAVAMTVSAAELAPTGQCGENVYWNYNSETGELVISGTGNMYNYNYSESPFYNSSIKSVIIEDGITSIGSEMFYECEEITNLNIGKDIAVIADLAFYRCYGISNISVDEENVCFTSDKDGVLFNKDKTLLIQYPIGNSRTSYTVPDGVEVICKRAFSAPNSSLLNLTLSNSVQTIEEFAFVSSYNLENVILPYGLKTIGYAAFRACHSLTDVVIPNSVTTLEDWAFDWCVSLTSIIIPENVTSIGSDVFCECTALESVTINCKLTEITSGLFSYCSSLKKIILPDTITKINESAFSNCINLCSITIPKSTAEISSYAFSNCTNLAEICYNGSKDDWSNIKIYKFGNEDLTNVEIHYIPSYSIHHYNSIVTPPTCSTEGYTTNTCSCGYTYIADKTPSVPHTEIIPTIKYPATCTKNGEMSHICTSCGKEIWTSIISASGHKYVHTVTKKATHLENGIITYTCACGDSYTKTIAKLENHSYILVVTAPTCTTNGYTTYTCECGDSYISDYVDMLQHNYSSTIIAPATHLKEGIKTFTCGSCSDSYTESVPKTKDHNYTVTNVVAPTCEEQGYTTFTCACGDTYKGDYVSTNGHSYDGDICKICGESKIKNCSCNCHKTGFMAFIWKILRFFYKLFKINPVCTCGVAHY